MDRTKTKAGRIGLTVAMLVAVVSAQIGRR